MIGFLRGKIIDKKKQDVWVEVNGVGYRVRIAADWFSKAILGEEVNMYIHTAVREDAITLYGFKDRKELDMFELVIEVSGVGPKTGMNIVGSKKVEQIEKAVREADVAFFSSISGIGKKGAQRIIVDLKSKIGSLTDIDLNSDEDSGDEVVDALVQFGFMRNDVVKVVGKLDQSLSVEDKIRAGLKMLGKR